MIELDIKSKELDQIILQKSKSIYIGLPRDRDDIFAASGDVDIQILINHGVIERIARPFVAKKIKEYLGVEEDAMIKLVINHLTSD